MEQLELLSALNGMTTICLRKGKADEKTLERAHRESIQGISCPGFPANFRKHVLTAAMQLGTPMDACLADAIALPVAHVGDEIHERTVAKEQMMTALGDMLMQDMNAGGDAHDIPERHAETLFAFVAQLHDRLMALLRETQSWSKGTPEDRAYHLLDIALGVQTGVSMRGRELAKMPLDAGTFTGLPVMIATDISRSTCAKLLRTFGDDAELLSNVQIVTQRSIAKPYTVPSDAQGLVKELQRAQRRLAASLEDAQLHRSLREEYDQLASMTPADDPGAAPLAEGTLINIQPLAAGDLHYVSWRHGRLHAEELRLEEGMVSSVLLSGNVDDRDNPRCRNAKEHEASAIDAHEHKPIAQVLRTGGRLFVHKSAPYAGLSPELLPPDAPALLHRLLNHRRTALAQALKLEPVLASQARHLPEALVFVSTAFGTLLGVSGANADIVRGCLAHSPMQSSTEAAIFEDGVGMTPLSDWRWPVEEEPASDAPLVAPKNMREMFATMQRRMFAFAEVEGALRSIGIIELPKRGKGSHRVFRNEANNAICTFSKRYAEHATTPVPVGIFLEALQSLSVTDEQLGMIIARFRP